MSEILCIGHRGAMGHEPENTLRSFERAIGFGCSWIELDVYFVDGELLVIHDGSLERTTNGRGLVQESTLEYLRSLDAGKGERIPTLREVFEKVNKRCSINVELKGFNTAEPVARLMQEFIAKGWDAQGFCVSSFNHPELRAFRKLLPEVGVGALLYGTLEGYAACAAALDAFSINVGLDFVDRALVEDAHSRNIKVYVYTINQPKQFAYVSDLGVDGIFSNYPDRFIVT